ILVRPAVEAGESLGYLPGDLLEKIDPYFRPLYDAMYEMMPSEKFQKYMERGIIEIAPLAYMRGRTLNNSFIILDDAQNTTLGQMKMFLTRFGFGSKVVINGDIFIIYIFFQFIPVGLWISAIAAGVKVGIFTLVGMRLRRVPPHKIVSALIKATKAGLSVSIDKLEAHFLAGGDVDRVVDSLIAAERAGLNLTFEKATAIDLAGRNVLEAVQMSAKPKPKTQN
ncbi:unnamed protein product, partial [marine sediment metagenome]